ncbi:MAG: NOL1/NOP2/sun family putative RNA methylase [Flavobacteriales bacterium]|jgi:NOL1/NOP2/sun family putative RNA methylase|nr:NOL1/NOP2/sun family putative RNA methylase [Flavobacteriales bacterium]|tara:strand:+ start:2748 stop:3695 length:948 start_codon:yes stop_codon:yes gene_type:complete
MPTEIPDSEKIEFKEKFIERYEKLTDFELFKKYSLSFLRRSIRVNTIKISISELKKRLEKKWVLEQIPWCKEGFYIEHIKKERRDIGNLIEHSLGYFYTQEAASMIPPIVLEPKENDMVLDIAASPGSKATQIAALMNNKGILIANDLTTERMKPLSLNIQRCGITNCIITLMQGQWFKNMEFDKILVDAPCSGTGTIRKSLKTLRIWNPNMVKRLSITQKQLIETAFNTLKQNGTLVYSTCSLEPEENEAVIDFLLNKYENAKLEPIKLPSIKRSPLILEFENNKYNNEIKKCLRIWPQDNDTEGFFVTKIKKS